jgi:hypothetical protein
MNSKVVVHRQVGPNERHVPFNHRAPRIGSLELFLDSRATWLTRGLGTARVYVAAVD